MKRTDKDRKRGSERGIDLFAEDDELDTELYSNGKRSGDSVKSTGSNLEKEVSDSGYRFDRYGRRLDKPTKELKPRENARQDEARQSDKRKPRDETAEQVRSQRDEPADVQSTQQPTDLAYSEDDFVNNSKRQGSQERLFDDEDAAAASPKSSERLFDDEVRETEFSFDRYGRRAAERGKRGKKKRFGRGKTDEYGKRKNVKRDISKVVTHQTTAQRELDEAQKRAKLREDQRQKQRDLEEKQRRAERRVRTKKRLAVMAVLLVLIAILCAFLYFVFLLKGVDVSGTLTRTTAEEVIEKSGLTIGRHMLFQDLAEAKTLIEQDPYLNASVEYVFPNRIQITIVERKRVAAVMWGPKSEFIAIIDYDGIILESSATDYEDLPLVRGLSLTRAEVLSRIGDVNDEQVQGLLDVLEKINEYGIDKKTSNRIVEIDVGEAMNIIMLTESGYTLLVGPPAELDMKFRRLSTYWDAIMSAAASYKSAGSSTVTVYLYSRNGVTVSQYSYDYVLVETPVGEVIPGVSPSASPDNIIDPYATNNPDSTDDPNTPVVTPAPTNVPYASDPFTG
ncbi:MAG TPA: FtsQ-type POTRA domain-containing protein [Eubacteriales bacterium]|nr:FtsQ-type POTRA domain-containing protein [Eubacteriales bacterium]